MADEEICSFCHKGRLGVLHLFVGPGGCNICDECIVKATKGGTTALKASGKCCFCGKEASKLKIVIAQGDSLACEDCVKTCRRHISEFIGGGEELLSEGTAGGSMDAAFELMDMVRAFARHSYRFDSAFREGKIDWAAHNDMEQLIHPIRSKAGRLGNEEITEIILDIDNSFNEIHFDDIESNAPTVRKFSDLVDRLLSSVKRVTGG